MELGSPFSTTGFALTQDFLTHPPSVSLGFPSKQKRKKSRRDAGATETHAVSGEGNRGNKFL